MSRDVKLGRAVLGKTGIEVSRLCFGALTMSPLQCDMPPERGAELILYAYERGVDFVEYGLNIIATMRISNRLWRASPR